MTVTEIDTAPRTIRQRRRDALEQDALLFCGAFTLGAALYFVARGSYGLASGGSDNFWTISLSDDLILSGLIAGELFLVWNNGLRQGVRGHSIGKHRVGLRVVDARSTSGTDTVPGEAVPIGAVRGVVRGVIMAVLLDLAVAAIPIGLPTVLRRLTPESWHFGGAAYLALLLLVVPLLISTERGFADRLTGSRVVLGSGARATTAVGRRRALVVIDVLGVAGVLCVALVYVAWFSPLLRFPHLW